MAGKNFEKLLTLILRHEGGYVNHPKDPGGATNFGVTQRTYDAYRKRLKLSKQTVKAITTIEVHNIYRRQYWDAVRGSDLPAGIDYVLFDYAVNSGPAKAAKAAQRILGVGVDGIIGDLTVAAFHSRNYAAFVNALCDERLKFMKTLKTWKTFGKGWQARVADVRRTALSMVSNAPIIDGDYELVENREALPAPKADPIQVKLSSTGEGRAGAAIGVGALGAFASEAATQLTPLIDMSPILRGAFVALTLVGVGAVLWLKFRSIGRGEPA